MAAAPLPADEDARLAYLEAMAILDTAPEASFDRLVQLAQHLMAAPIALVTFVTEDRQWFKARVGLDVSETPREHAFCAHAILEDRVMVIPDATADPRFADNPLVTGAPEARFYAGAPLATAGGNLGTLCVIDTEPRTLSDEQEAVLLALAETVVEALEKRVEARRAARHLRWLRLAEGIAKIGHWRVRQSDGSLFWSPEVFAIYGLDPKTHQPTVESAIAAYHPDDRARVSARLEEAVAAREPFDLELRLFRPDGDIRWVRSLGRPEVDPVTSEVVSVFGIVQDVTRQKLMQSELLDTERLSSLGLMAATMAHEINNPLASMQLNAELIGELVADGATPDPEKIRASVADLLDGIHRIQKLTQELRAISRPSRVDLHDVDLKRAIDAALRLSRIGLGDIEVSTELAEPLPTVRANEPRLVQVLLNLLLNASHAFEGVPESQRRVIVRAGALDGTTAFLEIEDSGVGIAPELRERVFEPFFTTKSTEEGTGLGLYVCREIVRSFGGSIQLRFDGDAGTIVHLQLSSGGASATAPPPESARSSVESRSGTRLLVIDDDAMVGRALGRALRGYAVEVEQDPRSALRLLQAQGERYAAILCDLAMPKLSGPALHAAVVAERPELDERFLFITGGTQSAEGNRFTESNRSRVFPKPLDFESLLEAIDAIVREREAAPGVGG